MPGLVSFRSFFKFSEKQPDLFIAIEKSTSGGKGTLHASKTRVTQSISCASCAKETKLVFELPFF